MKTLFLTVSALIFSFSAAAETVHIYKCQNIDDFYVAISLENGNNTAFEANDLCLSYGSNGSSFKNAAHALNAVAVNVDSYEDIKDDNSALRGLFQDVKENHAQQSRDRRAQTNSRIHQATQRRDILDRSCWYSDISTINGNDSLLRGSNHRKNCF